VHGFQMRRNASALLDRARLAEAGNKLDKAEEALSQYLSINRDDGATWAWYARVVDRRDSEGRRRERIFLVHEQALRHNPGDLKLERRCADLALELGRYNDARQHLMNLEKVPRDSQGQSAAAERAELEDLLGQCERALTRFEEAENWFDQAVKHDPRRVSCYDRLARLLRTDLRRNQDADGTIKEMVAKNPKAGRAYLYRWRYTREFLASADANDIQKALELAPDDPEVLLTAAVASEQKPDAAAARAYLEKGSKLDPKNFALAVGLAGLETREGHLDRAEAVLRRADQAKPSLDLAFILADTLIAQDKIEGKDQAADYITRLRNAGQGDTLVRYLEARILFRQKRWVEAIPRIEMARAVLKADPQLTAQLNLMLAECYSRVGSVEQRLDALRQAAAGGRAPEAARIEFAQALARSGKLDQALAILLPLADRKPELRLDLVRLLIRKTSRQRSDQRNWPEVDRQLRDAAKALPQSVHVEALTLLRADLLTAQGRLDDARSLLSAAQAKDPRNLPYRLALARLTQRQGKGPAALQILDQAEKELGPSQDIQLARLDYWGRQGGAAARAAVARLAEDRGRIPAADQPAFLGRLASVEVQLRELSLARQHGRELAELQPDDVHVRLTLFDLSLEAGDQGDAASLVKEVRQIEGDTGMFWRFAQAALLIDKARRGASRNLDEARALAAEISERQPDWWVGPSLNGEIAELAGSTDQAIDFYIRAVELGNLQPSLARRLVGLLTQRNRPDEIDRVAQVFRDRGVPLDDITIVKALSAIRKQDFDGGIALARQVFSDTSTSYSDHLTLGRLYMDAGRSDEAGKEFRRAVELGPGVPACWLDYVRYLVQTKHIDQARAVVEAARKTLPADRLTVTLAECSLVLGDLRQAEDLIGKALEDEDTSADPATLRLAATLSLSQNRLDKVDEYLKKLGQVAGASPGDKAWANRIRVAALVKNGRVANQDQALALVDQNLGIDPQSVEDRQLKATILALRPSRRDEAVRILEQLAGANQLAASERFLLAQLYLGQPDEQKYQGEMRKLLNLKVRDPRHLAHFISYWIGRNQLDQADRWLSELKKTEPLGLAALEAEARLLDLRKRKPELLALIEAHKQQVPDQIGPVADLFYRYGFFKEAEAAYKELIARNPRQPEGPLALAVFLARQDRVSEAIEILKKAWSTCPPERVAAVALVLYDAPSVSEEQRRQVEAWCVEASRRKPDAVGLSVKLGLIWIRQGRFDEADAIFRRILSSDPDHVEALNNLAWLLALRDPSKAQEALGLIDHAIVLQGPKVALIDTRAVALIRAGNLDQAVTDLRNAQRVDPRNPSVALHLAWAYQQIGGSTDQARKALAEAEAFGWTPASSDPLERTFMDQLRKDLSNLSRPPGDRS